MENNRDAMVDPEGSGEHIWFNGSPITIKVASADTGNAFDIVEVIGRGGNSTPLHVGPSCETFCVLEGAFLFHVAGKEVRATVGDLVVLPQGIPHALQLRSQVARALVLNVPGGHDRFFRAAGTPAPAAEIPPPGPPDMKRMKEAAQEFGIEILGPPPFRIPSS
jgi:quercetin dioxygenase-like cupin family protein